MHKKFKILKYKAIGIALIFICLNSHAFAEKISNIKTEIANIDSLIKFGKFKLAENLADSFFTSKNRTYTEEQKSKLLFLKAKALDRQNILSKALAIYLDLKNRAENAKLTKILLETNICISLIHEKNGDYALSYAYLKEAIDLKNQYNYEQFYSTILVRLASLNRQVALNKGSIEKKALEKLIPLYYNEYPKAALRYADMAIVYSKKHNNEEDLHDAYLLHGIINIANNNKKLGIDYLLKCMPYNYRINDFVFIVYQYFNIANCYIEMKDWGKAKSYNDSVMKYKINAEIPEKYSFTKQRAKIYKLLNQVDSAYYYLNISNNEMQKEHENQQSIEIKKIEKQFSDSKNEITIQNKNKLIWFILILLGIIAIASIIVFKKNSEIAVKNKLIKQQVIDLQNGIEQKQILLSELQHRVKNNLQYVISILEMQKESLGFSNPEDLIRNNQNRIHSIALLHKKLNVVDTVNIVELKRYIYELAELVKISFHKNNIQLNVHCEVETLSISKALPVGLIMVELISNSIKHAFDGVEGGIITIEIKEDPNTKLFVFYYKDNGKGFDFNKTHSAGLGLEIMTGLLDQLNASLEMESKNGFGLIFKFK